MFVGDVVAELVDLTQTKGRRITLRDLVDRGTGRTVLGLLASTDEFGAYDTREDDHAARAGARASTAPEQGELS